MSKLMYENCSYKQNIQYMMIRRCLKSCPLAFLLLFSAISFDTTTVYANNQAGEAEACWISRVGDYICNNGNVPERPVRAKPPKQQKPPRKPKPKPDDYQVPVRSACEISPALCQPTGNPPPPPADCKAATTPATVNPGNFKTAVAGLGGGRTIVLAPGSYPSLGVLSGKNYGGSTIQCAQPGQCRFPASKIRNVSGLTIDGIFMQGVHIGLQLENTRDMTVRCSSMKEMASSGIVVVNSSGTLKLQNNTLYNSKLGCSFNGECYRKKDGSVLPEMDYGLRIHIAENVEIQGNRFTGDGGRGMFNHAVSLKEKVGSAFITGNTFDACGRICIETGQEPTTTAGDLSCGQATVNGNTFNNVIRPDANVVMLVKNIHRVTYNGNTFNDVTVKHFRLYTFTSVPAGPNGRRPGSLSNGGVPRDRVVIGNGS